MNYPASEKLIFSSVELNKDSFITHYDEATKELIIVGTNGADDEIFTLKNWYAEVFNGVFNEGISLSEINDRVNQLQDIKIQKLVSSNINLLLSKLETHKMIVGRGKRQELEVVKEFSKEHKFNDAGKLTVGSILIFATGFLKNAEAHSGRVGCYPLSSFCAHGEVHGVTVYGFSPTCGTTVSTFEQGTSC